MRDVSSLRARPDEKTTKEAARRRRQRGARALQWFIEDEAGVDFWCQVAELDTRAVYERVAALCHTIGYRWQGMKKLRTEAA